MSYLKQLDEQAWPIVYARFDGASSVEGFAEFTTWLDKMVERSRAEKTRFVLITDARGSLQVSADVRRHIAQWVTGLAKARFNANTLGTIVVVDSAVVRGVMTAISWVSREQMASVSSQATIDAAWRQATELVAAAGMPMPLRPTWALERVAAR